MGIPTQIRFVQEQYKNAECLNARIEIHKRFSTNPYGWSRWIFDYLNFPAESSILELGCGTGDLWLSNLSRIPNNWQIFLSDFSPGMVQTASKNLGKANFPTLQVMDAQSIPYADETFDAVIANHMLYHVPDRQKALSEIHRVLKPGGVVIATTVGLRHMIEVFELSDRFLYGLGEAARKSFNVSSFCLENGIEILNRWFHPVECHDYEDALEVRSADLLTQYILSINPPDIDAPNEAALAALQSHIEAVIEEKGYFYIKKNSGLFKSYKQK